MAETDLSARFEDHLRHLLERHLGTPATEFPVGDHAAPGGNGRTVDVRPVAPAPALLAESISYSLLAPGKRIRPRLLLACARMLGLSEAAALAPAAALEMIHCFTLIHDDLPCMDDDDFRRGRPSNHKKFGEAAALLAGDSLIGLALDSFLECAPHVEPRRVLRALARFHDVIGPRGVIGGQAAEWDLDESSDIGALRAMHARKTGALFAAALLIPMDLAGIEDRSDSGRAIHRFACQLGLAFQAADDLEDSIEARKAHTNLLSRLSEEEVRASSIDGLREGAAGLEAIWGEDARPLVAIADEVIRLLRENRASEGGVR